MAEEGRVRPLRLGGLYRIDCGLLGLLLGLSGCGGSAQESPAGFGSHEAPAPVSMSSDSRVAEGGATARRVAPQPSTGLPTAAPAPYRRQVTADTSGLVPPATSRSKTNPQPDPSEQQAREQWYAAARESPDVTVRLQILNQWAQLPGETLDPVTYALVDEDESVRAHAQELYEQRLMWEEGTSEQTEQPIER